VKVTKINLKKILFSLLLVLLLSGATLAAAPSITSLSPSSAPQGWVGHITITGSNFASGATVTDGAGLTDATTGFHVISTTVNSSGTTLDAYVRVAAAATQGLSANWLKPRAISYAGYHLITVTNPDGGVGTIDAFTVTPALTDPAISGIFIDGTSYTAGMPISRQPRVSGSMTATQGFTQSGIGTDFKILVDNVVKYDNLTGNVSIDSVDPTKANFRYTLLPYAGFAGPLDIHFNVKDKNGNTGELICSVNVQVPVPSPEVRIIAPPMPDPSSSINHNPTPANPISMQFQVTDTTPVTVRVMGHTPIAAQTAIVAPGFNTLIWDGTAGGGTVMSAAGVGPLRIVKGNKPADVASVKATMAAAGAQGRELVSNGIVLLFVLGPDGRPLGKPGKTAVLR
jgi:hypothetical protein